MDARKLPLILLLLLTSSLLLSSSLQAVQDNRIVLDEKKIANGTSRTIYDLLNQVPGIKATPSAVSIRGSVKVLVLLDGRAINDPTSTYGGVRWDVVDLSQVKQVVILRGKGGVEYGDNASGGVIDITTQKINRMQGSVDVKAGNQDTREINAGVRRKFGVLGLGINGGYFDTSGFRINGDKQKRRIETRLNYDDIGNAAKFDASIFYFDEIKGYPGLPEYPTVHSRAREQMASGVLNLKYRQMRSKTVANWGNKETKDPEKSLDNYLTILSVKQEIAFPVRAGSPGVFNCGAGAEYATADATGFSEKTEEKAYLFITRSFSFKNFPLSLYGGLRGIYYSEYDNGLSPEISLQYKKKTLSGKLTISRTFNAPSFTQKYRQTSSTDPNPDLTMEKATNYTAMFSWEPDSKFSLSISPFYNIIDDRITYVRNSGIGQYQNLGEVTYKGTDAGLSIKPWQWLSFQSSYTYLEAKDQETGLWLSAKPKHRWINTIDCKPVDNFTIGITATASSWTYGNSSNTRTYPGYLLWDVRAEYVYQKLIFTLEIENIFDHEYFMLDGYPGDPLTWIVGVTCRF